MITTKLHPAPPIDDNVDGIQIDHNNLLADLLECNLSLLEIAKNHGLNLTQLIAWAAQPAIRALLDAADELARRIAAHKAEQGRPAAVQTLIGHATGLYKTPRELQLANLAARTIVRITTPPKPASRRNKQATNGPASLDTLRPSSPTGARSMIAEVGAAPTAARTTDFPISEWQNRPSSTGRGNHPANSRTRDPLHRTRFDHATIKQPPTFQRLLNPARTTAVNGHAVPSAESPRAFRHRRLSDRFNGLARY